jgi:putative heme iron utilization protein
VSTSPHEHQPWTARRFFGDLSTLGPLRVISQCGPSTFEAICEVGAFGIAEGYLNAITASYHWHLRLDGFGHLRSRDETHQRSGRRVLFFELAGAAAAPPFLAIYLYRGAGEDLAPERLERFGDMHRELAAGVAVEVAR